MKLVVWHVESDREPYGYIDNTGKLNIPEFIQGVVEVGFILIRRHTDGKAVIVPWHRVNFIEVE